ncbi:MAG: hypothetical protein JKY52_08450 [Flavobacteriales bacterium]|nr:hypothetical protein [Flavobacteriales bacterium]
MSQYTIDKNIPIPDFTTGTHKRKGTFTAKYPFVEMEIGDSIFFERTDKEHILRLCKGANAAYTYASNRLGWNFMSRCVPGGFRVWRVAIED